jgi:hypothetical protein
MQMTSKAVPCALAALMLGGVAQAATPTHLIRLTMPDGSIQKIRYTGKLPPRIIIVPARSMPLAPGRSRIANLERIMAEMERRTDAMLGRTAAMARGAPQKRGIASMPLPPGTVRYSFVSTSNGGKTCARSVRVTAAGDNRTKVVSQTFGDCGQRPAAAPPARAKAADKAPGTDPRRTI